MKTKIIIIYFFILLSTNSAKLFAIENKILFKIENKIITSVDIFNEVKYLKLINKNIETLDEEKIFEIAKNSLIQEKIKEIEVLKKFKKIDLNNEILEKRIIDYYSRFGVESVDDFNIFFQNQSLKTEKIKRKIAVQTYWNNIIYSLYSDKVIIDKESIKKEILKNSKKEKRSFLLSEIVFEVKNKEELNKKFQEIKESIESEGFNNTASLFSVSSSSKIGGELGWINENSLNTKIKKILFTTDVDKYTDPIKFAGGFLILKINDIKSEKYEIDVNKELNKIINQKTNEQLNSYSNVYFNKLKKNIQIEKI